MANLLKVSDVTRTATLLKKLVDASDINNDGAVRIQEARWGVDPKNGIGITSKHPLPGKRAINPSGTLELAVRFTSINKSSSLTTDIKKSVDELANRARAADTDKDGFISEVEMQRGVSNAERNFVMFGSQYAHDSLSDFNLPTKHETRLPSFSWSGTPAAVCTSLLNAFSDRKNDNFWGGGGASRYVLSTAEAQKMVKALEPLFATRQKAIISELASRTLKSEFGCVSVSPGARTVFEKYAAQLAVTGLHFQSPAAPRAPAS